MSSDTNKQFRLSTLLWVLGLTPVAMGVHAACSAAGVWGHSTWLLRPTLANQSALLDVTNNWTGIVARTVAWSCYGFLGNWFGWILLCVAVIVLASTGWRELRMLAVLVILSALPNSLINVLSFQGPVSFLDPIFLAKYLNAGVSVMTSGAVYALAVSLRQRLHWEDRATTEIGFWRERIPLCIILLLFVSISAFGWLYLRALIANN